MRQALLVVVVLAMIAMPAIAADNTIKGKLDIQFNSRVQADESGTPPVGVKDVYTFDLTVLDTLGFQGTIQALPTILTARLGSEKQKASLVYNLNMIVANPANLSQKKTVGKLVGEVQVDKQGIYHFDEGTVRIAVDAAGNARVRLRPTDMAATLTVSTPGAAASSFVGALPMRSGGLHVDQRESALVVTSATSFAHATIGLLSAQGLLDVRSVNLTSAGAYSRATMSYDKWPSGPLWAMVSTETELDTGNTIGWPLLDEQQRSEIHNSLVVPNALVLDGWQQVSTRLRAQRRRALIVSSTALLCAATLLGWVIIRANQRHKRQIGNIMGQLLTSEDAKNVTERTPYALIAVLVITAALMALGWWVALGVFSG
jgi:hypothetical protein